MSRNREAWEQVLATVELQARRAEALLVSAPDELDDDVAETASTEDAAPEADPPTASTPRYPADWRLPTSSPDLPLLTEMPPVPEELRERVESLRSRIDELQTELAHTLNVQRAASRLLMPPAPSPSQFVDRKL